MNAWSGKSPSEFGRDQTKRVETVMRRSALMLVESLTFITPVETGRARSNWIVTTGTPSAQTIPDAQVDKQGTASRNSAEKVRPKIGTGLFISNNLPYIEYLENGTDRMAPFNMVKIAVKDTARRLQMELNK